MTTTRAEAAAKLGINARTIDQHYRRFLFGAGLENEPDADAYTDALIEALALDD